MWDFFVLKAQSSNYFLEIQRKRRLFPSLIVYDNWNFIFNRTLSLHVFHRKHMTLFIPRGEKSYPTLRSGLPVSFPQMIPKRSIRSNWLKNNISWLNIAFTLPYLLSNPNNFNPSLIWNKYLKFSKACSIKGVFHQICLDWNRMDKYLSSLRSATDDD